MTNLEIAKQVVKAHIKDAECGIFSTRNFAGDDMCELYDAGGLVILICYKWAYYEVFGLSDDEFDDLKKYYHTIAGGW